MMNNISSKSQTLNSGAQNIQSLSGNITIKQKIEGQLKNTTNINSNILPGQNFNGTKNYNKLENKPQINGVTLEGDKTSYELKLQDHMLSISNSEIENLLKL